MANLNKHKRRRGRQASAVKRFATPVTEATIPAQESTPSERKIVRVGKRLLDSAIESALSNVWTIVGGAIGSATMTAAVALILFFRAPESAWVYSILKYGLVYFSGILTVLLLLVGLILLGVRRRKLIDARSSARFASVEKGYLDHWLHFGESNERFRAVLVELGSEMICIGKCSFSIGQKLANVNDAKRAHRIVTKGAASLDKHASKMERSIEVLEKVTNLLLESTIGLARNALPASQGNVESLEGARQACLDLLERVEKALKDIETFRTTTTEALGISQLTNSAMNRITHGLESLIGLLQQARGRWRETVVELDRKLAS